MQSELDNESISLTTIFEDNGLMLITPLSVDDINMKEILGGVIENTFHQSRKNFEQDLLLLNDLRSQSLYQTINFDSIDLETVTKLKKYYNELIILSDIFPEDTLQFQWAGRTFTSWKTEIILVGFQLASYYSILAIKESDKDEEGLKKAGIYFQYSAGYMDHIKTLSGNGIGIFEDEIEGVKFLMLAQSQEMYVNKAFSDNLPSSVLLKLSIQISDFYAQIKSTVYELLHKEKLPIVYFNLKECYYKCLSYDLYATLCHNKKKYGDEISFLDESLKLLEEVGHFEIKDEYSKILQDIENLRMKIVNKIENLKYENTMLHLQPISSFHHLKQLPRATLVKCLLPKDAILDRDDTKIFLGLIPLDKVNMIMDYQSRFEEFIKLELIVPIEKLNDNIHEILAESKVDFEIKQLLSRSELPSHIINYYNKLQEVGNLDKLETLVATIQEIKVKCRWKLDSVWRLLKEQVEEEGSLIQLYGHKWKLGVIEDDKVGGMLVDTFRVYENYMKQSENGDKLILTQVDELYPFLKVYDDLKLLEEYIPDSDILTLNPSFRILIESIQTTELKLNNLKVERIEFLKTINARKSNVNLLNVYKNTKANVGNEHLDDVLQELLTNEIMKFKNEIEYITQTRLQQEHIIVEFNNYNLEFTNSKKLLVVSAKRKEAMQVLESTYKGYFEVIGNLNQGKEFYQNLMDNIDVKTEQLNTFIMKRIETKRLLKDKLSM